MKNIFKRWLERILRFTKVSTIFILVTLIFYNTAYTQIPQTTEAQLKAAYLFNFLKFVQWPDSVFDTQDSPIVIGILGKDPFGSVIDELVKNEKIGSHPIIVKRYKNINEVKSCNALYVSSSEGTVLQTLSKDIGTSPILTVSDIDNFSVNGGDIGFYTEGDKLRFTINIKTLQRSDLKVSSKLLRLAKVVSPSGDD
jgi:YfiR/HmsC-like